MESIPKIIDNRDFDVVLHEARRVSFSLERSVFVVGFNEGACGLKWGIRLLCEGFSCVYEVRYDGTVHEVKDD